MPDSPAGRAVTDAPPYLLGLLGAGIGPSLTPGLHMEEARHHGLTYLYRRIDTAGRRLDEAALRALLDTVRLVGFDALNVTFPHKQQVVPLLDHLDAGAARLGAVNTVLVSGDGLVGHNTDVTGFATAVQRHLPGADLTSVVQLGAGGAGAAVADALLTLGVSRLVLVDHEVDRARALATGLRERFAGREVVAVPAAEVATAVGAATGLVNCTPSGMAHHPGTPLDPDLLESDHWVADIVYRPLETELLRRAAGRGCQVLHGGYMAVYQAAHTFELVTGRTPDAERMLRHLRLLEPAPARVQGHA